MQFISTTGEMNYDTVQSTTTAKAIDVIVGQPSMDTMYHMTEQMAKMVAAIKTSAGGGGQKWLPHPRTGRYGLPPPH